MKLKLAGYLGGAKARPAVTVNARRDVGSTPTISIGGNVSERIDLLCSTPIGFFEVQIDSELSLTDHVNQLKSEGLRLTDENGLIENEVQGCDISFYVPFLPGLAN